MDYSCILFHARNLYKKKNSRGAPDPEFCYPAGYGSMPDPDMSDPARSGSEPDPNHLDSARSGSKPDPYHTDLDLV